MGFRKRARAKTDMGQQMTEAEKARLKVELRRRKRLSQQKKPQKPKSMSQVVKDNLFGDDDDTTQNFGEKIGAFLNKAGEAMTFGLVGDEASAAAAGLIPGGMDYDERLAFERQNEAVFERDNPGAALTAEIGGGIMGLLLPGGAVGTLGKGAGIGARVAASGASGAGMGGLYGFMEGEGAGRLERARTGALWGAGGGAVAPAIGSGAQRLANNAVQYGPRRAAIKSAKTAAGLRRSSGAAYDAFDGAGAELSPAALSRLRQNVVSRLDAEGAANLPKTSKLNPGASQLKKVISAMDADVQSAVAQGKNPAVPLKSVEDFRRVAGDVAQGVNPIGRPTKDARLATIAIEEVDNFIDALKASDVPIGDEKAAKAALEKARSLWKRSTKTQLVENALDAQDDYLGGGASAIRNKIGSMLRNPKTRRQFSDAELKELRKIIGGNGLTRAVRLMGNGIGRQLQMAGGAGAGGLPGMLAGMLTGEITAGVANRNAINQAEAVRALVSSGALEKLPTAPGGLAQISETLARRIGAVVPQ